MNNTKLYEMLRNSYAGKCHVSANETSILMEKGDWQLRIKHDGSSKLLSPNYPSKRLKETTFSDDQLLDALKAFEAGTGVIGD